jgi:hypothetical protein
MLRSGEDPHNDPYSFGPNRIHAQTQLFCDRPAEELIEFSITLASNTGYLPVAVGERMAVASDNLLVKTKPVSALLASRCNPK